MGRYVIRKGGLRRGSTIRKGHWRRKPGGGHVWVEHHHMRVMRRDYFKSYVLSIPQPKIYSPKPRSNFFPSYPIQDKIEDTFVNRVCDISSTAFPQYAPLIETGRFLYNHREEVSNAVNIIFSDKTADSKLTDLASIVTKAALSRSRSSVASFCARKLTDILDSENGFSKLNQKLDLGLTYSNEERIKIFFQSNIEGIISNILI